MRNKSLRLLDHGGCVLLGENPLSCAAGQCSCQKDHVDAQSARLVHFNPLRSIV
jgi:hypothetical protein